LISSEAAQKDQAYRLISLESPTLKYCQHINPATILAFVNLDLYRQFKRYLTA